MAKKKSNVAPVAETKATIKIKKNSSAVKVATPPTAEAKVTKAKPAATKKDGPSRNRSRDVFDGRRMGIMEYQDYTFTLQESRRLTDAVLCADWQTQFPSAVKFEPHHVAGARRDYNNGRHSSKFPKPTKQVPAYGETGKPTVVEVKKPSKTKESKAA